MIDSMHGLNRIQTIAISNLIDTSWNQLGMPENVLLEGIKMLGVDCIYTKTKIFIAQNPKREGDSIFSMMLKGEQSRTAMVNAADVIYNWASLAKNHERELVLMKYFFFVKHWNKFAHNMLKQEMDMKKLGKEVVADFITSTIKQGRRIHYYVVNMLPELVKSNLISIIQ